MDHKQQKIAKVLDNKNVQREIERQKRLQEAAKRQAEEELKRQQTKWEPLVLKEEKKVIKKKCKYADKDDTDMFSAYR